MLHHVSLGVGDLPRALTFYDAALGALGYQRVMEVLPYAVAYGTDAPQFWVQLPSDRRPATVGNGVHVAFEAATRELVAAFHRAALAAGGRDDGAPGPRPEYNPEYYGAFVRDPDGNKVEAVLVRRPAAAGSGAVRRPAAKRKSVRGAAAGTPKAPKSRNKARQPARRRAPRRPHR